MSTTVVILGCLDEAITPYAVSIDTALLSEEHQKKLANSFPSERKKLVIPGCDKYGAFATDSRDPETGEMDEPGNLGLRWHSVKVHEELPLLTKEKHCVVHCAWDSE
jgi:hypothetical protein